MHVPNTPDEELNECRLYTVCGRTDTSVLPNKLLAPGCSNISWKGEGSSSNTSE